MRRDSIFRILIILSCLVFLILSCGKTKTEDELMSEAENALKENNPKIAIKAYKDIIRLHPQSPNLGRIQTLVGIVYLNHNDEEKMRQAWDEVKTIAPDYDLEKGLYDEAQELQNHDQPELAVKIYQKILQRFPDSPIKYQAQFLIGFVSS